MHGPYPHPTFPSEDLCTQVELAASPRRPDLGEADGGASCRVSEEASVYTCKATGSHLVRSEGRRLFLKILRDFKNSLISRMRRRCGEGRGGNR